MYKFGTAVAAIAISILVVGLLVWSYEQDDDPAQSDLIADLYSRFDRENPGYGLIDYPGTPLEHTPKSYAKVLMAELVRTRNGLRPELPSLVTVSGRWLLDNSDLDGDGLTGWGVATEWDAYGDGSINPAHTRYTISTAIVVESLLDWMEQDTDSPGPEILKTVSEALVPYVDSGIWSPSGLLPYSFVDTDRRYNTFNPAAYLAGQMQRFSLITSDNAFAESLRNAADSTVRALLDNRQINSDTQSWYWNYSIEEEMPNDLPHASYIFYGLFEYKKSNGQLSNEIDLDAMMTHLNEFYMPNSDKNEEYVRGWPRLPKVLADKIGVSDRAARSYDLGMVLSLLCNRNYLTELVETIISQLPRYRTTDGAFEKYPLQTTYVEPLIVNEYEAYLYHGVVACEVDSQKDLPKEVVKLTLSYNRSTVIPDVKEVDLIPFVKPFSGKGRAVVTSNRSQISVNNEEITLSFPQSRIPITIFSLPQSYLVIVRNTLNDKLFIEQYSVIGSLVARLDITATLGTEPIYRNARIIDNYLYVVYYDNIQQRNYLASYSLDNGDLIQKVNIVELPLLEDPAGSTYEMIPYVDIFFSDNAIDIVGGSLHAKIAGNEIQHTRLDGCLKVIEAVQTPKGPAILCLTLEDTKNSYVILAPFGIQLPTLQENLVPFNLDFSNGYLSVKQADSHADLQDMLVFDIERIQQNGWLEFGISNTEGRIPWSQIYYLNGFLDFIYLAKANSNMNQMLGEITSLLQRRLDLEISLADEHWREGRYETRAFTIDRSPALFAVQTSRLLLLMTRYIDEIQDSKPLSGYESLHQSVHCLENHIETLNFGTEPLRWLSRDTAHLSWPRGSKFYFDGVAVPFNHQNEWAYSILESGISDKCPGALSAATQILKHFQRRIAPNGNLPMSGQWDYWWGTAYEGWDVDRNISINKPQYEGDKGKAWISFRSIDVMSNLAGSKAFGSEINMGLLTSASHLVASGEIYPFVNYELVKALQPAVLNRRVAKRYARINSPWDLQNAAWSYLVLSNINH